MLSAPLPWLREYSTTTSCSSSGPVVSWTATVSLVLVSKTSRKLYSWWQIRIDSKITKPSPNYWINNEIFHGVVQWFQFTWLQNANTSYTPRSSGGPLGPIFTWINELNSELLQDFPLTAHLVFYSLAPEFHSGVQQRPNALYENKTLVVILLKDFWK